MNIRDVKNTGKSQALEHRATIKLRGEDTDMHFVEPNDKAMEFMNKHLHVVERLDEEDLEKRFGADLNRSHMLQYNVAIIAFTLVNESGELEFGEKSLEATHKACGAFLYGKDEDGKRAFSNAEIASIAAEARKVLAAETVEDHEKN
jgi:hypothetical protein